MKRVSKAKEQAVKIESVIKWPKCDFCGFCHQDKQSKCPRIKSMDQSFGDRGK